MCIIAGIDTSLCPGVFPPVHHYQCKYSVQADKNGGNAGFQAQYEARSGVRAHSSHSHRLGLQNGDIWTLEVDAFGDLALWRFGSRFAVLSGRWHLYEVQLLLCLTLQRHAKVMDAVNDRIGVGSPKNGPSHRGRGASQERVRRSYSALVTQKARGGSAVEGISAVLASRGPRLSLSPARGSRDHAHLEIDFVCQLHILIDALVRSPGATGAGRYCRGWLRLQQTRRHEGRELLADLLVLPAPQRLCRGRIEAFRSLHPEAVLRLELKRDALVLSAQIAYLVGFALVRRTLQPPVYELSAMMQ
jgi:hypothetical protein